MRQMMKPLAASDKKSRAVYRRFRTSGERAVRTEKQVGTRLVMQRTRRAASIASAGSLMGGLFLSHPASYIGGTPA